VAFVNHVQSERRQDENIRETFDRVTHEIEEKTNLRHFANYASFRVVKHRVQKAQGIGKNQLALFKS